MFQQKSSLFENEVWLFSLFVHLFFDFLLFVSMQAQLFDYCKSGDVEKVQKLVQDAMNREESDDDVLDLMAVDSSTNRTPLMLAAEGNHKNVIEYLLERGVQVRLAF